MSAEYPICANDGCDQPIWLRPDERTVCAGCEKRGGPPPPAEGGTATSETDEDRVRHYLSRMTPDERAHHVDLVSRQNTMMGEMWNRIAAEL
ncbi:hypothetical protein [Saccharomonospora saliphila]|uniref:hypothetical protein n=1 Tax=Saccharomonospora saliphila TaxID=369829 RepID=UPI000375C963|nr:hypothetical protein [Saccharomonospora saliphila]